MRTAAANATLGLGCALVGQRRDGDRSVALVVLVGVEQLGGGRISLGRLLGLLRLSCVDLRGHCLSVQCECVCVCVWCWW